MSAKTDKDLEFFRFLWEMLRGVEGYFMAGFFWVSGLTLLFAVGVLATASVSGLIGWISGG